MRKLSALSGVLLFALWQCLFAAAPDPRVALVANLYREFAWEVVVVEPHAQPFLSQPETALGKYLAPNLVRLILKDRACAKQRKEVCWLDFSPIWSGNDPAAADLRVTAGGKANEVVVRFTHPYDKKAVEILYDMVQVDGAWRISNIRTKEWSLVSILESPL